MFGWFRPTCPVDAIAKGWLEERLGWLSDQFGFDTFTRRAVVLPTADFFPDPYDRSDAAVRRLFERVCRYMEVDPRGIHLEFHRDHSSLRLTDERGRDIPNAAAGLYGTDSFGTVIRLETTYVDDPMDMVGTIAHELAHHRLLGENRISRDVFDNELLTDLTVVFHGMGIFLANRPHQWDSMFSVWPGTSARRPEYMTYPMYGYALALSAWCRNEERPPWAKHLRMDSRASFKQGLRYLRKTGDSGFRPAPRPGEPKP